MLRMTSVIHWRWLSLTTLSLVLLSACGFQLRNNYHLPEQLQHVYVQGSQFNQLLKTLKQRLVIAGAEISDNAQHETQLRIINDTLDRRTLSLFESGQVAEYELIYRVQYELVVANKEPLAGEVEVFRDYQDDPNFALAKTREREILVSEMRQDAANRIIYQLISSLSDD